MTAHQHSILLYLRPQRLVHVRVTGPYEQSVPRAWEKLFGWFRENGIATPTGRSYGIAHDNPADIGRQNCRYDACFAVTPETDDRVLSQLAVTTLRGGAYACSRFSGTRDLTATARMFYAESDALPGLAFDLSRPVLSAHYGNPLEPSRSDACTEICVPVIAVDDVGRAHAVA